MAEELAQLASIQRQRKGHRSYVTRTINNVNDLLPNLTDENRNRLESYRQSLSEKIHVLNALDADIADRITDDKEIEDEIVKASDIKDEIQETIIKIDKKFGLTEKRDIHNESRTSIFNHTESPRHAKLPKLSLRTFGGNPVEWQSFWDGFKAAVHENNCLEDIAKFNYLKSYLQGEALSSIAGLTLTAENYEEAIKILVKRYGNKQLLITTHIDKLMNITPVYSVNDVKKIRKVYDEIEAYARNLKA